MGPRIVATALLLATAVVAGLLAWGALENLFRADRDSAASTYLLIGLPALALTGAALYATVRIWRR